ncbi:MAG: hypothetical protein HQL87_09610 [Magnetococcales bacterium]|nr:hypothetical protein [Magnetococcales bacterium]
MTTAVTFDTHKFIKQMVATGFTEEQAETQVALLAEVLGYQLSTKDDVAKLDTYVVEIKHDFKELDVTIERLRADLKRDIKELDAKIETTRADLKRDIKEAELCLEGKIAAAKVTTIQWTAGMFVAQTALIIGALFAMLKMNQLTPQPVHYQPATTQQELRLPVPEARPPVPETRLPPPETHPAVQETRLPAPSFPVPSPMPTSRETRPVP